jgi:hypothetical protein
MMNYTKLARWIEQAEARSVCELAEAEPGSFKVLSPSWARPPTATQAQKTGFLGRLAHRRGAAKGMLSSAA